jgi:hypothetical protein
MALIRRRKVRKGSKKLKRRSKRGGASKSRSKSRKSSSRRSSSSKKIKSSKLAKLKAFFKTPRGKITLAALTTSGLGLGVGLGMLRKLRLDAKSSKVANARIEAAREKYMETHGKLMKSINEAERKRYIAYHEPLLRARDQKAQFSQSVAPARRFSF